MGVHEPPIRCVDIQHNGCSANAVNGRAFVALGCFMNEIMLCYERDRLLWFHHGIENRTYIPRIIEKHFEELVKLNI